MAPQIGSAGRRPQYYFGGRTRGTNGSNATSAHAGGRASFPLGSQVLIGGAPRLPAPPTGGSPGLSWAWLSHCERPALRGERGTRECGWMGVLCTPNLNYYLRIAPCWERSTAWVTPWKPIIGKTFTTVRPLTHTPKSNCRLAEGSNACSLELRHCV